MNEAVAKITSNFDICKDASQMQNIISDFVSTCNANGYGDYYASEDWCRVIKKAGYKANTAEAHLAEIRFWKDR